jgi:hypothetical protein
MKSFTLIFFGLFLLPIMASDKIDFTRHKPDDQIDPLFSGLHTLSIHIRDTAVHDSLFLFLTSKLKLPVYYYPLKMGKRRYAGVYAGNLVLEPCGPYSNFSYASKDFKAIFFGLTFEPYKTLSQSAKGLTDRKINYELDGDVFIYPKDSVLCGENITISIMDKADKISDRKKLDSLRYSLTSESKNELGIEYVKELWIGYKNQDGLSKWKDLIKPSKLKNSEIWNATNMPELHFIKSDIKEVMAIVFKVKSLGNAKRYLSENDLSPKIFRDKLELEKSKTFGLSIFFSE